MVTSNDENDDSLHYTGNNYVNNDNNIFPVFS